MRVSSKHSTIIAFSGKLNGGKDFSALITQFLFAMSPHIDLDEFLELKTVARARLSNFHVVAFAAKLKKMCALATGTELESWYNDKDAMLPAPFEHYSRRSFMTAFGDQCRAMEKHFFSRGLFLDYKKIKGTLSMIPGEGPEEFGENWLIPDVRFEDEVTAVEEHGGIVIRVTRPLDARHGYEALEDVQKDDPVLYEKLMHTSETALDNHAFDYEVKWEHDQGDLVEQLLRIYIDLGWIVYED